MFHTTFQPRFSECDGLGHINNSVPPVWFEEARTELFKLFNPSLEMKTWNLILKRYDIDFRAQIWRDYPIEVETEIVKIGNTSLTVEQRAIQQGTVAVVGHTTMVHFDYKAGRPEPIPEAIKEKLAAHVAKADA